MRDGIAAAEELQNLAEDMISTIAGEFNCSNAGNARSREEVQYVKYLIGAIQREAAFRVWDRIVCAGHPAVVDKTGTLSWRTDPNFPSNPIIYLSGGRDGSPIDKPGCFIPSDVLEFKEEP